MFDAAVDQAAGLRRLFRMGQSALVPAGCLVPVAQAQEVIGAMAQALSPEAGPVQVLDRRALHRWLDVVPGETQGRAAGHVPGGRSGNAPGSMPENGLGSRLANGLANGAVNGPGSVSGNASGHGTGLVFWLDDPVETARWVHAQAGDRLLLVLSHRRETMMPQYAQIKRIAATTGIRRFGVLFADVEQAARGRETFLNLAGCTRRFLSVQLDVVVGSCRDEAGLRTWSGLSLAELAEFQWASWSGVGVPPLDTGALAGGVAH